VSSSSITSLNSAYKHESDVLMLKERILLVRRVMSDGNKEVATVSKEELHRSKAWAYKWLARFKKIQDGLYGLKDMPRSGRPFRST
jgi:transposase